MHSAVRTVAPAAEPISLDTVKAHLRLGEIDEHDELLQSVYIPSARADVESITHRALITQTWVLRMAGFPAYGPIRLPHPPLQSVTSVQYVDANGATQTWDAANYVVDSYSTPGVIEPAYGFDYPTARGDRNSVTITYVAGYGTTAAAVPADIRNALLLIVADRYAQPEDTQILVGGERALEDMPKASQHLLSPYVLPLFG